MAVADGTRLLSRLRNAIKVAENSAIILPDIAFETIADVRSNANSRLAGQEYQVGFDLEQFNDNIATPGRLHTGPGTGRIGILDPDRMGTLADFDSIGEAGLFHQGTKDSKGVWRNVVYPDPELREEVAQDRQAVWGDKTPQWFLLEEGWHGDGAFPDTPAHHFIHDAAHAPTIFGRMQRAAARLFAGL